MFSRSPHAGVEPVPGPMPAAYLPSPDELAGAHVPVDHDVLIRRVSRTQAAALMQLCDRQTAELSRMPGRRVGGVLELMEALFEPPLRAWAWMAERGGEPIGHAFATVGFSMIERAYYFNLESLFVPASERPSGVAVALLAEARRMAETLGCVDLRWQVPLAQGSGEIALPGHAGAATMIQYVFPTLQDQQHD
jgi:GNAT superfamily N-acetyltransferase